VRAKYPLVLLHALPLDSRMWAAQVHDLSPHGVVLAPDLPGFGKAGPAEPSVDLWAERLALWLRGQGLDKVVIAGCSMGGYTALAFRRQAPAMLAGIALVDSRISADTEAQRAARLVTIEQIERDGLAMWGQAFLRQALSPWTLEHKPALAEKILEIIVAQPVESVIAAQHALAARPDSTGDFQTGKYPTVDGAIIHGVDDKIVPLEEAVAAMKSVRFRLVVVQNAGHLAPLEQPETVTSAIREFWCQCGSYG
jgi:pimeloyl-ACP methyl ester carboxylesterase